MDKRKNLENFKTNKENKIYRYGFNLNSSHRFLKGLVHSHTFKITIFVRNLKDEELLFRDYELKIIEILDKYRGLCLNDLDPFDKVTPTLENMAIVFYSRISKQFEGSNIELLKLEVGDGYTNSIAISKVLITNENRIISNPTLIENMKLFLQKKYGLEPIKKVVFEKKDSIDFDIKKIENFDNLLFNNFKKNLKN